MKAAYGKPVRAVWAADGGQRFKRASSDPTGFSGELVVRQGESNSICPAGRVQTIAHGAYLDLGEHIHVSVSLHQRAFDLIDQVYRAREH